jgi:hypothetical protein
MWGALFDEGQLCCLQLQLAFASAFILRSKSHRTRNHILLPRNRDSRNLEGQVPIFISTRSRTAQLYPQALGSFVSPPVTRRYRVEVFEPASTRETRERKSQSYFTTSGLLPISSLWRQARWGSRPKIFFGNKTLAVIVVLFVLAIYIFFLESDPIENTVSNSSLLWRHVLVVAETCISAVPYQRPSLLAPLFRSFRCHVAI